MKLHSPAIFALGVVTTLTFGGTVAYAATGGSLIIGGTNKGGAVTKLSNPNGVALALTSKDGTPSLSVNRTSKVANLNADLFDGKDSSAFALAAGQTGIIVGSANDADHFSGTAQCPSGTVAPVAAASQPEQAITSCTPGRTSMRATC